MPNKSRWCSLPIAPTHHPSWPPTVFFFPVPPSLCHSPPTPIHKLLLYVLNYLHQALSVFAIFYCKLTYLLVLISIHFVMDMSSVCFVKSSNKNLWLRKKKSCDCCDSSSQQLNTNIYSVNPFPFPLQQGKERDWEDGGKNDWNSRWRLIHFFSMTQGSF